MTEFYDSNQNIVRLGSELGRGGEGTVYEVLGNTELVAKIYHEKIAPEKAEKLRQMTALKSERLLRLTAWVTDVLHDKSDDSIVGFLMPRINSGKAIHELYNPRSRRELFPDADWRFLIYAATNLARSFAVIHSHGHAIGDVNHGNVVISKDSTVRLIDCDSYHLNAPNNRFLCEVGVSTHTPPELQGKSLRGVVRTADHDAFGLAVLIFQVLFMGRHPFSGNFLGAEEDNSLEDSILEYRFAYGEGAAARQMQQPPGTPSLSIVSPRIINLFERAFLSDENRPVGREWIEALKELSQNLRRCEASETHYFLQTLEECPWCRLEKQSGVIYFPLSLPSNVKINNEFDFVAIENLIDSMQPPVISQSLPASTQNHLKKQLQSTSLTATPHSTKVQAELRSYNRHLVAMLIVVGIAFSITTAINIAFLFIPIILVFWFCSEFIEVLVKDVLKVAQSEVDVAEEKWRQYEQKRRQLISLKAFENTRDKLKEEFNNISNLEQFKETKLKEIEAKNYQEQLQKFLNNFPVSHAFVNESINLKRTELLNKVGIKTAADINKQNFAASPIFDTYTLLERYLYNWRAKIEKQFVYRLSALQRRDELQEMNNEVTALWTRLNNELKNNFPQLQSEISQINKKQREFDMQSEQLVAEIIQAKNDLSRFNKYKLYEATTIWIICVAFFSSLLGMALKSIVFSNASKQQAEVSKYQRSYQSSSKPTYTPQPALKSKEKNNEINDVGGKNVQQIDCLENSCQPVQDAYISHFTNLNCTGQEFYYTPYFGYDGIRRSWDGRGLAGTEVHMVTNKSWKDSSGRCYSPWPDGNTLNGFVRIYRSKRIR